MNRYNCPPTLPAPLTRYRRAGVPTQLLEALRHQKVQSEELIFPDEIHDFMLRRDWIRAYTAGEDFFRTQTFHARPPLNRSHARICGVGRDLR